MGHCYLRLLRLSRVEGFLAVWIADDSAAVMRLTAGYLVVQDAAPVQLLEIISDGDGPALLDRAVAEEGQRRRISLLPKG